MSTKFTDRFLKIPVDLYTSEADLVGYSEKTKSCTTVLRVLPFEISHYRPAVRDGEEFGTMFFLKNGDDFEINMPIEDFEKLLNDKEL